MALLLESWELPVLFRWTFVKQDCRIREILELKSTTETCKSKFSHLLALFRYRPQFWQPLKMAHDPNQEPIMGSCPNCLQYGMVKKKKKTFLSRVPSRQM